MAGHHWEDWFEREEFIGQISDIRVQNLQVERELVQKRTFTRWMNLHLEKCDPPIEVHDLFRDIQDGHILMALLEELSGCKLLHGFKKSSHRIFRLNNIAKVLSFLEERNVKLVSIDAADVADGNSSIVLGLIWNIILFFQIKELTGNIRSQFPSSSSLSSIPTSSDSDASFCSSPSDERQSASTAMREHSKAIKKLLQWVQKRTRKYGVAVQDFGKSWTSGLAFLAVIKSIDPSLVDMRKAMLRTAKENLEDAFRIGHYSLGIARLLEPEDVTINAPDEQSIMTYVSQFLEHFPGIEEPEESCQVIERSVSMGRLNFRDIDSNHMRNGAYRSRVKERSYMFQRSSAQTPPKILISSVSEDRSAMSPPFRPAATRSWSTEDFLADSPHMEDISSSVAEETKDSAGKVESTSPQLSYTHSPTGSSVPESVTTESVVGDSAISSPESWVESEFGVTPEKFSESRSDSSLCDSGTAWDVYRATPVEVTPLDEEFVPSMEDRAPDGQSTAESFIDEGIYSLSSLESTQEKIQGQPEKERAEVVKVKEVNQDKEVEHEAGNTKEVDYKQKVTSQRREQEPFGMGAAEELTKSDQSNQDQLKQTGVEKSAAEEPECLKKSVDSTGDAEDRKGQILVRSESQPARKKSEEFETETERQKKEALSEKTRGMSKEESGIVETQDQASEEGQRNNVDPQESLRLETSAKTHPANQDEASKTSQDTNVPLISVSSEPERQGEGGTCNPERQGDAGDDKVHQAAGTDANVSNDNVGKTSVEITSFTVSENVKPAESDQKQEKEISKTPKADICQPSDSQSGTTEEDLIAWTSTDAESQPLKTEQEMDSTNKLGDTISDSETSTVQKTPDPVNSKSNNSAGIYEPGGLSKDTNFDQNSPTEDLVGDPIEPMDLFYPDKEEPLFTELPDTEMQSWPSVLSVSALQPAPTSETQPDQLLDLLGEDFKSGEGSNGKVITETTQDADKPSKSQEQSFLVGTEAAGLWGGDAPAGGGDLSEAEQHGSARENTEPVSSDSSSRGDESQIAPVLRHRKGARFTEATDHRTASPAAARRDDTDSDVWWADSGELYLLLLLWLLLYCFWLLPQMELKTLPSMLLNL